MVIKVNNLKKQNQQQLLDLCKSMGVIEVNHENMIFELMKAYLQKNHNIEYEGHLEIINNYGFLRDISRNFIPCPYDVYISSKMIKENQLRYGDKIKCNVSQLPTEDSSRPLAVSRILQVNDRSVGHIRPQFEKLTATYPKEQISLSNDYDNTSNLCSRLIDLFIPQGFGHRSLVVAPPKTGKTTILHSISLGIAKNYPEKKLVILLIDERPEEVTEMKKLIPTATIVSSTFDEARENQARAAEITCEYVRRYVEYGEDVVLILDSITRLARSYNAITPSSGKILSGGIEPGALQKPKRLFGSARNTQEAGSLTIIASALTETGSRMDEYILEEFIGTGNSQIYLDKKLAEKRIFPAINLRQSSTRKIETMLKIRQYDTNDKPHLTDIFNGPRKALEMYVTMSEDPEIIKTVSEKIRVTKTNREFLQLMQKSSSFR